MTETPLRTIANEGRNNALRGVVCAGNPVFAREGSRLSNAQQLFLKLVDFFLDLRLVDAVFSRGNQLGLDFGNDVDGAVHRGIGGVDLGGAEAESVGNGRKRLVVGTHGRCDRPVGGIVGGLADAQAGRNMVLGFAEALVDAAAEFGELPLQRYW